MRYLILAVILTGCAQIEIPSEKNAMCLEGIRVWGYQPVHDGIPSKHFEVIDIHVVILNDNSNKTEGFSYMNGNIIVLNTIDQKVFNHEFGHVLGVPHINDPMDLMYPYKNVSFLPSPIDIVIAHSVTEPEKIRIKCKIE